MKEMLALANEKRRKLESKLVEVGKSNESLKLECSNKDKSLKAENKRERERKDVADTSRPLRIQERNEAQAENQQLKEAMEKVKKEE